MAQAALTIVIDAIKTGTGFASTQADLAKTKVAAEETTASAETASGGFNKLAVGALAAGVAVGVIAEKTIKAASTYQSQLTALVTGAGESQSNINMISKDLLQMAVQTGTTTTQLTSGLYMIESAGFHGAAGLNVLKAATEGAKVGNADLGTVADATTTIMKDFGGTLPTQAVNTLIATVANGKTHMSDLASSLSAILPTASSAKVSLNDVMGAMATMTGEGVPAANAATYLRQTIIGLEAPSTAAKTALQNVGLSSDQVASTMQKSLPDALKMITDAVGKKFPEGSAQYVQAIKDISGGSKTMQGMLDLTGQHMKDFQGNVGSVSDAVKKGGNAIQGWGDVQKDTSFKTEQLKAALETASISIGQKLLPVVNIFIKDLTTLVSWLSQHLSLILKIVGVIAPLAAGILIVVGAMKAWEAAQAALNVVMDMNPVLLAIMAVAAIAILVVTHWNQVKQWFDDFWHWLKDNWKTVVSIMLPFLALPILIISHWKAIATFFDQLWQEVEGFVKQHWKIIIDLILGPIGLIISNWSAIANFFSQLWKDIETIVKSIVGFYVAVFKAEYNGVIAIWNAITGFFSGLWNGIKSIIGSIVGFVDQTFRNAWNAMVNIWSGIGSFFGQVVNWIRNAVSGFGNLLYQAGKDLLTGFIRGIEDTAGTVMNAVKGIGDKAVSALKGVLKIFSPSQVFAELGGYVGAGLAQGITGSQEKVGSASAALAQSAVIGATNATPATQNIITNTQSSATKQTTINIQQVVLSTAQAVQQFITATDLDSINVGKGLTPTRGYSL